MKYGLEEGIGKLVLKLEIFIIFNDFGRFILNDFQQNIVMEGQVAPGNARLSFEPSMLCPPGTIKHAQISRFFGVHPRLVVEAPPHGAQTFGALKLRLM
jgi:hypothetical protein